MDTTRRSMLRLLAAGPAAAGFVWTDAEAQQAHQHAQAAQTAAKATGTPFKPKFFTRARVRDRADAGRHHHPEGRALGQRHRRRRAGVHGLHHGRRAGPPARDARRPGLAGSRVRHPLRQDVRELHRAPSATQVLDAIAWPQKAAPEMSHGVAFFNRFRDLTASGFWTSRMGIKDLGYIGNVYVPEWTGCPDEVLKKLGRVTRGLTARRSGSGLRHPASRGALALGRELHAGASQLSTSSRRSGHSTHATSSMRRDPSASAIRSGQMHCRPSRAGRCRHASDRSQRRASGSTPEPVRAVDTASVRRRPA